MKLVFVILLQFCITESKLNTEWWRHTNMYEIIVYNFKDSNDDGIGDLKGIISKLDYLKESGIETIYLPPMFNSGGYDIGYDIKNYTEIEPMYGTMEDFDELMKQINTRGMKLILDLVINHSSHEHEWFKKSEEGLEPYTDYYVWKKPTYRASQNGIHLMPPNNWESLLKQKAWTWNEKRQKFYYHFFLKEQPDLNLRNENVKKEIKAIIKFWLDKGVSGFRLDAPMCYMEDKYFRDDEYRWGSESRQTDLPESFQFIHELREFLDEYNQLHGGYERIFVPESRSFGQALRKYHGTENYPICHFTFNYFFSYIPMKISAAIYDALINLSLDYLSEGMVLAWVSQDHDTFRVGTRICPEYKDIITITTGLLPGIVHYYYGQEIGLINGYIQKNQIKDHLLRGHRDPTRLLMQWDDSINSGFSTNYTTIIPVCTDYHEVNVEVEKKQEVSHYSIFKSINKLRRTETIKYGTYGSLVYSANIHIFWRSYEKHEIIFVITNLDDLISTVNLNQIPQLPERLLVVTASTNSGYKKGITIGLDSRRKFKLKPLSSVVLSSY